MKNPLAGLLVVVLSSLFATTVLANKHEMDCSVEAQEETNKALFRKIADGMFTQRDLNTIDQYYSDEYLHHGADREKAVKEMGITHKQYTKGFFTRYLEAFPDLSISIDHLYAEGDKIFAFVTMSGIQQGEFMGMPPSGKKMVTKTAEIFRIKDGQFVEHWDVVDSSGGRSPGTPPPGAGGK